MVAVVRLPVIAGISFVATITMMLLYGNLYNENKATIHSYLASPKKDKLDGILDKLESIGTRQEKQHAQLIKHSNNLIKSLQSNLNSGKITAAHEITTDIDTDTPRIAAMCYIPLGDSNARQFIAMLYGSWKYVKDNHERFKTDKTNKVFHYIDLLAFCHPSVCSIIHTVCKMFRKQDFGKSAEMNCWAIEQTFESPVPYGPINSFVMFNRTDIHEILSPYEKVLRSDFDVFITPALLTWQPEKKIVFGQGGYCDPFNMKRLKSISTKLGMRHQGIHCIGSSWYGETELFIQLSKKSYEMTGYMWVNEFDPNATGLETIDFKKNREGEWVRWWRPVSSMYGAELAINDLIDGLSNDHKGKLDTPACSKENYLKTPHIHCWHDDCEFQKFKFFNQLHSNYIRRFSPS